MHRKIRIISKVLTLLVLPILALMVVPEAQSAPPNQGGNNLEVGIDLEQLNQIKEEIAQGEYDRPCTEEEHDRTKWHLVVNPEAKCHYDHHHGDDPNYVNDIFGSPGEWFDQPGQSISYPWQTFGATTAYEPNDEFVANEQMENDLKHEGYGWIVRRDQPCGEGNCITDFRLQYHGVFGAMGAVVRYHSYSFEARVCADANDPSSCGIVRNGGWADFGRLFTTSGNEGCGHGVTENFISLPADTLFFPIDRPEARDEIRCHPILSQRPSYPDENPIAEWWAHSPGDRIRFQLRSFDALGNINPNNPSEWHLHCDIDDVDCRFNQSIMTVWIGYVLQVPQFLNGPLDQDSDGQTEYFSYGDRWGHPVESCTEVGLDCVPMQYDNVMLNLFPNDNGVFREARYEHDICDDCPKVDYDLAPPGDRWITWYFRHAGTDVPQPTPEPTDEPTPDPNPEPNPDPLTIGFDGPAAVDSGQSFDVSVNAENVSGEGLYGAQVEIHYDPTMLSVGNVQVNPDLSFELMSSVDEGAGVIKIVASREGDVPGLIGNVNLLTFEATAGDNSGSTTLSAENVKMSDPQAAAFEVVVEGYELSIGSEPMPEPSPEPTDDPTPEPTDTPTPEPTDDPTPEPTGTPSPEPTDDPTPEPTDTPSPEPTDTPTPDPEPTTATVTGQVIAAGRANNNWSGVSIVMGYMPPASGQALTASDVDGNFSFSDMTADAQANITADAAGYLPSECTGLTVVGPKTELLPATLVSGDITDDVKVDVADATAIGIDFEKVGSGFAADINLDQVVDVFDLVLVSLNFGKEGAQPWTCQQAPL